MLDGLSGRTLIVTGGATGLGAAVAQAASKAGARVAVLDINEAAGRATAARAGGKFWHLDVSSAEAWERVVGEVEADLGPIRFAHLNAAIMWRPVDAALSLPGIGDMSIERYRKVAGINMDGVFFGLSLLLPRMTAAGAGAVTVTISTAGLVPVAFDPVYSMTKHALVGLIRAQAAAFVTGPVRLNAICPGGFSSDLLPAALHAEGMMTPADVANEVLDLLQNAPTGEIRVKLSKAVPAFVAPVYSLAS